MYKNENRIGVAITGASGVRIGLRLVEFLSTHGFKVFTTITSGALRVAKLEEGLDEDNLLAMLQEYSKLYMEDDFNSPLASSSSVPRVFIVAPASMKTIAAMANGFAFNLAIRGALSTLRIGGRLVVAPRETPISSIDLENLLRLSRAGAIIVPLCVAFYTRPTTINDIVDFLVGKILDAAGIDNNLYKRWALEKYS